MSGIRVNILGMFTFLVDDGRELELSSRMQEILAYLIINVGKKVSRTTLADLIWDGFPEDKARHNLRQQLSAFKKLLDEQGGLLDCDSKHICIRTDSIQSDWLELKSVTCIDDFLTLSASTVQPLLSGYSSKSNEFESWLTVQRQNHLNTIAKEITVEDKDIASFDTLKLQKLKKATSNVLRMNEVDETINRQLIRVHLALGEKNRARLVYDTYAMKLKEHCGIEPKLSRTELFGQPMMESRVVDPLNVLNAIKLNRFYGTVVTMVGCQSKQRKIAEIADNFQATKVGQTNQMAYLFGYPCAYGDETLRAVEFAKACCESTVDGWLLIHSGLFEFDNEFEKQLEAQIQTINELKRFSTESGIYVDETTQSYIDEPGNFECIKADDATFYRIVKEPLPIRNQVLVGRDLQVLSFIHQLESSQSLGKSMRLIVRAGAGFGKTCLMNEFAEKSRQRKINTIFLHGNRLETKHLPTENFDQETEQVHCVLVDDADRLNDNQIDWLKSYLLSKRDRVLFVVLSVRDCEGIHLLEELDKNQEVCRFMMDLPGLSVEESRCLAKETLKSVARNENFSMSSEDTIHANPLFIQEAAKASLGYQPFKLALAVQSMLDELTPKERRVLLLNSVLSSFIGERNTAANLAPILDLPLSSKIKQLFLKECDDGYRFKCSHIRMIISSLISVTDRDTVINHFLRLASSQVSGNVNSQTIVEPLSIKPSAFTNVTATAVRGVA